MLAERVEKAYERMQNFRCECDAIHEPHVIADCTPIWQAVSRGERVCAPATVAEARALNLGSAA